MNDEQHLFHILFKAAEHAGSSNQSIHIRLVQTQPLNVHIGQVMVYQFQFSNSRAVNTVT